jgi:hypothetical protein
MINPEFDSIPLNTMVTQAHDVTDNHGGTVNHTVSVGGPEGDHFVINAEAYLGANTIINLDTSGDSIDLIAALRSNGADARTAMQWSIWGLATESPWQASR